MPVKEVWERKHASDAQMGNTPVWEVVERAKQAGISAVQHWRKDMTIGAVADQLHCYAGVNEVIEVLTRFIQRQKTRQ